MSDLRPSALLAVALVAACATAPPPPDPSAWAANAREHGKLMDMGDCHRLGEDEGAAPDSPAHAAAVARCMQAKGYRRTDSPLAGR